MPTWKTVRSESETGLTSHCRPLTLTSIAVHLQDVRKRILVIPDHQASVHAPNYSVKSLELVCKHQVLLRQDQSVGMQGRALEEKELKDKDKDKDRMFCKMSPVIEQSVVEIAASKWLLGSSMICESDLTVPPEDVNASWKGDDGKTYYLRAAPASLVATSAGEHSSESFEKDRVHSAGTSAAVWAFGGVHLKVKSWIPELESEQLTIEYARKVNIPVPEVILSWVDHAWDRSFLILRSIPGRTLDQAWPDLSFSERRAIADEVASFCRTLAMSCHKRMATLSGKAIREDFLTRRLSPETPSWTPNVAGPFTAEQLASYLGSPSITTGPDFYFYHADLGPTNIILGDDNSVAAVIDWESAAFYPRFWIATKPLVSAGFYLSDGSNRHEWAELLSSTLEAKGFNADVEMYQRWRAAVEE